MLIEPELKENERDFETLENLFDEAKRDLTKTFTDPSDGMIVDDMNVKDWVNKADKRNNNYLKILRKTIIKLSAKLFERTLQIWFLKWSVIMRLGIR